MRRLHPDVHDETLGDLYTGLAFPPPPTDRPHVYLDMVASVDGAATAEGRTGPLGGEADRVAFSRLREWCDAILVGASTVRIEDYGPPRPSDAAQARRRSHGLEPVPRLVVVTATLSLNPAARLFADRAQRPLVLVPEDADPARRAALAEVSEVSAVGRGRVDLVAALRRLRASGVRYLLCEGGPTLNTQLLSAGLVDELFVTISPQLVGSSAYRIVQGPLPDAPQPVELLELREHRGELLLRYGTGSGAMLLRSSEHPRRPT